MPVVQEPEDNEFRQVCCDVYRKVDKPCDAIRVATAMKNLVRTRWKPCSP